METICIKYCERGSKSGTEKPTADLRLQINEGKFNDIFVY